MSLSLVHGDLIWIYKFILNNLLRDFLKLKLSIMALLKTRMIFSAYTHKTRLLL